MKFSISHNYRSWESAQDEPIIDAMIEESIEAEERGFAAVFLPEHHFQGYCPPSSDAFQMAAYLAARLERAWLGMAVCVVPLHHPTHLVEKMNLLDQLTKGRVLFGVGSGLHAAESLGFGLQFEHQINHMMAENLEAAEALWDKGPDDPPVSFQTSAYKGTVLERVVPSPYRKRRPNFMGVAKREVSTRRSAEKGWPVWVFGMEGWDMLKLYREELVKQDHDESVIRHCMEWTSDVFQGIFVADTDEEAKADMLETMAGHEQHNLRQWPYIREAERLANVSDKAVRKRPPVTDPSYYGRFCLWGNPDTVSKRIQEYEDVGLGNLLLSFNNGLFTPERRKIGQKSIDLFVKEVMPRFADKKVPADPLSIDLSRLAPATQPKEAA